MVQMLGGRTKNGFRLLKYNRNNMIYWYRSQVIPNKQGSLYFNTQAKMHDKYNNLEQRKKEFIKNTISSNPELFRANMRHRSGLPLRIILLLIIGSSTITITAYCLSQYYQFKKDGRNRSFFIPLWFNLNWPYNKKFEFIKDLKHIDEDFFHFLTTESKLLPDPPRESELDTYSQFLQSNCVKRKVFEAISANPIMRRRLKVPLEITLRDQNFEIWIESKFPTISGVEIQMCHSEAAPIMPRWCIVPINFHSVADESLNQARLNLDALTSDQEYLPPDEANQLQDGSHRSSKEYWVIFRGTYFLQDKHASELGSVKFSGMIDFNHLKLDEGVTLKELDLTFSTDVPSPTTYKLV